MSQTQQISFNPLKYAYVYPELGYCAVDDYAIGEAKKDRDAKAKEFKAQGYAVKRFRLKNQLVEHPHHPHIKVKTTIYYLNATK